jgi:hypothetical protein
LVDAAECFNRRVAGVFGRMPSLMFARRRVRGGTQLFVELGIEFCFVS